MLQFYDGFDMQLINEYNIMIWVLNVLWLEMRTTLSKASAKSKRIKWRWDETAKYFVSRILYTTKMSKWSTSKFNSQPIRRGLLFFITSQIISNTSNHLIWTKANLKLHMWPKYIILY